MTGGRGAGVGVSDRFTGGMEGLGLRVTLAIAIPVVAFLLMALLAQGCVTRS